MNDSLFRRNYLKRRTKRRWDRNNTCGKYNFCDTDKRFKTEINKKNYLIVAASNNQLQLYNVVAIVHMRYVDTPVLVDNKDELSLL